MTNNDLSSFYNYDNLDVYIFICNISSLGENKEKLKIYTMYLLTKTTKTKNKTKYKQFHYSMCPL